MSRARELAKLGNTDAIGIDGVDIRTGSIAKGTQLDVASNVNVTGVITATNFIGNASGLTGLGAVGAGLTVFRANNSLGAITKLNFDNTFGITDPASGLSTVTSGVTTANPRSSSLVVAGVSTLSGQVSAGNLSVTGVVTSTSFIKSGGTSSQYLMADGSVSASGAGAGSTADVSTSGLVVAGISTLANATFSGVSTFNNNVKFDSAGAHIEFTPNSASASSEYVKFWVGNNSGTHYATLDGNAGSFQIFNTSHPTGTLDFRAKENFSFQVNGYYSILNESNGGIKLYHPGSQGNILSQKFETDAGGVKITGIATATGLSVTGQSTLSNLNVSSGIATVAGQTTLSNLNVSSGIATVAGQTTLSNLNVATGIATVAGQTNLANLNVTGVTTTGGVRVSGSAGIITATGHVDSTIVTYYGDSSYSAAGRWVLGASGSDHYTFTGPGLGHSTQNDPALYLKRGQTYMFENKMGAHGFRIQSTANGSAGTQWNVGVTNNDVSNGVLIFEVPFVTPNTLYYQCTAHNAMGGVINIS